MADEKPFELVAAVSEILHLGARDANVRCAGMSRHVIDVTTRLAGKHTTECAPA